MAATKIYLLNSFLKKSSKDYRREIERAQKMLEEIL
jgi:phage-related protein